MKTHRRIFVFSFVFALLLSAFSAMAQPEDRSYIRDMVDAMGGRNVAITKTNGDLMLYDKNGWAANGCPEGLTNALKDLEADDEFIDDVQLTEDGNWLILYGDNGLVYEGIPEDLEEVLTEYNQNNAVIHSITFNDGGEWIVITSDEVVTSDSDMTQFLIDSQDEYGALWTACITDDGLVAVFKNGYRFVGEIPSGLKQALNETEIDVYRLKIAGESWFFSDGEEENDYDM